MRSTRRWPRLDPRLLSGVALLVVLLVAVLVRVPLLDGPERNYDEGVYWESLRAMDAGHPLFSEVYSSQPPAFLGLVHPIYALFGHSLVAARTAVMLLTLLGIVGLYLAGRHLSGVGAGLLAAAVLAVDPLALRAAVSLQAEGPAIGLAALAVGLAAWARQREGAQHALLALAAGGVLALGVLVKLFDVVAVPPVLLLLLTARRQDEGSNALRSLVLVAGGAAACAAVVLLPFLDHRQQMVDQVVGLHLTARSSGLTVSLGSPAFRDTLAHEVPAGIAAAVSTVVMLWLRPLHVLTAVAWGLGSFAVLQYQHPLFEHHVVVVAAPLALAAVPLPAALLQALPRSAAMTAAVLACIPLVLLARNAEAGSRVAADPATAASADALQGFTAGRAVVVTDDQFAAAAAGRDVPPQLVDTSSVRIGAGDVDAAIVESAIVHDRVEGVLFATGRLDAMPGLRAWVAAHFPHHITVAGRRTLYLQTLP